MLTKLSQFYSILRANRHGFSAKSGGYRKGTIRRGGDTPAEVVNEVLTGTPAEAQANALFRLFASEKRRALVAAAADATNLLYIYRRLFASTWKSSGKVAALRVDREWQSVISVRGQMLKALGLNDTLRGDDRLPGTLYSSRQKEATP